MSDTYTSGRWVVKPGEDDEFVEAWKAFVTWASEMPGSGTFRLARDLDHPNTYLSFAPWESVEAQAAWLAKPEFGEYIGGPGAIARTSSPPSTSSSQKSNRPIYLLRCRLDLRGRWR